MTYTRSNIQCHIYCKDICSTLYKSDSFDSAPPNTEAGEFLGARRGCQPPQSSSYKPFTNVVAQEKPPMFIYLFLRLCLVLT